MKKTLLIIKREYLTRVRKKSFIIMTILGPLLITAMVAVQVWIKKNAMEKTMKIAVIDDYYQEYYQKFSGKPKDTLNIEISDIYMMIPDTKFLTFDYLEKSHLDQKEQILRSGYDAILYIPEGIINKINAVEVYSFNEVTLGVRSYIQKFMEQIIQREKLKAEHVDPEILSRVSTSISIINRIITTDGKQKESDLELKIAISLILGILIFMFILMYSSQVMRGVIEEKTNRIVEIIVSSVKPFQLMMGKIIGVALVGLTQFFLWILLTILFVLVLQLTFQNKNMIPADQIGTEHFLTKSPAAQQILPQQEEQMKLIATDALQYLNRINFKLILTLFFFYFIAGYLLYSSLFAAVGSAIDTDTDTQQFMMPIMIPLFIGYFIVFSVFDNPDSTVALWASMIPFTSPIVMMARIPFGVPPLQIWISMLLLILTFIGSTLVAARIYRTGILLYGKKVNYRELWKWIRRRY